MREILGVNPWEKQQKIVESVRDNSYTCVASGHGVGKTFISAATTLWFLFTHPESRVITTAPTTRQVESILWTEIHNLYKNAKWPLGGRLLKTSLTISDKWFALGLSTDDPDRFQGHHARSLLLIMDEAPGIDPKIYEASQGILTSDGARALLIGNPTSSTGPFYDRFHNKRWSKFHISCYDSPGVADPKSYPMLTTKNWIEERKEEWGERSPMFQSRVLGQFPDEAEDILIPLHWCERAAGRSAKERTKDEYNVSDHVYLGLDIARKGKDKTVLTTFIPNRVTRIKTITSKDLMEAVNLVIAESVSAGTKLMRITIDDTSLGGGVTDRLRELGYPAMGINFSQRPTRPLRFRWIKDEMYWHMRELFRSDELVIPNNETLMAQLSSVKYRIIPRSGKIEIETKEDMRKRGLDSPDLADSLALALWGARIMHASSAVRDTAARGRTHQRRDIAYY
jgi:hypothetical protein